MLSMRIPVFQEWIFREHLSIVFRLFDQLFGRYKQIEGSNMKLKLVVLAFCLFFVGSTAFSSSTYYIPQVAIGSYTDSGTTYSYRTTFVFFNNQTTLSNVTLNLTDDTGSPWNVNFPGVATNVNTYSFTLTPGATKIIQTDSSGTTKAGAATIVSDLNIGVSGIYTINNDTQGKFVTEVGVPGTSPMSSFVLPVQITSDGSVNTGLAMYNPNDTSATVTLSLTTADGNSAASNASFTLAARQHSAFYFDNQFPSVNHTNFSGMLKVQSSAPVAAVTLRQNAPSFLTYTSLPVVPTTSNQMTFNLAQVADGTFGGAAFRTTFMLFNYSSLTARASFATSKKDGSTDPLSLAFTEGTTTDTPSFAVPANGVRFLTTDKSSNASGAVKITSDNPIGVAALFTQYTVSGSTEAFNTEAGVQDSPLLPSLTLPVSSSVPIDGTGTKVGTSFALYNPNDTSSITVKPTFLDMAGLMTTAAVITLGPKEHTAKYFDGLFPGYGEIQGSLAFAVTSTAGATQVSAVALRSNASPYNMTSFFVVSGTAGNSFTGTTARSVYTDILPNTTPPALNKTLPYAASVTASVTGYGYINFYGSNYSFMKQVHAVSPSGQVFKAKTDPSTMASATAPTTSTFYLAPGTYTFRAMGWLPTMVWTDYTTDPYFITSTTTSIPIAVPTPTYRNVSGTIANWGSLGITSSASLSFYGTVASNSHIQYAVYCSTDTSGNGTFTQNFPEGDYTAILELANQTTPLGATEHMGLQNIGTFSVSGTDATVNSLTIPTLATLSGTASFAGGTLPVGKFGITAADKAMHDFGYNNPYFSMWPGGDANPNSGAFDPTGVYYNYTYIPRDTTWTQNTFGGSYDVKLAAGDNYKLSYSMLVYNSAGTAVGTAYYSPTSGATVNLTAAGSTYDFPSMPAFPSLVKLSGKVMGPLGGAQTGTVIARSSSVIGTDGNIIPDLTYYASATEDASGNYTLYLLPGYSYRIDYGSTNTVLFQ